jgi:hypothetical protein
MHMLSILETHGRVASCPPLIERLRTLPSDPWISAVLPYYESWVAYWSARLSDAAQAAQRCIAVASGFGMDGQAAWGSALLCLIATEMGDLEAARLLLPVGDHPLQRQEHLEQGGVALRFRLAAGDVAAAERIATTFASEAWALAGTSLSDTAVEALLAAHRLGDAARLIRDVSSDPRASMRPGSLLRARARQALAAGDSETSVGLLFEAAESFAAGGYGLEVLRTRALLGEALAAAGDAGEAAATLQAVAHDAAAAGADLVVRAAEASAATHGIRLEAFDGDQPSFARAISERDGERILSGVAGDAVTVFVAGVRGGPGAASRDGRELMRRWAALSVEQHHGVVDQLGDRSVTASFNAVGWHENHAADALDVALELVRSAARVGVTLAVGIASVARPATGAAVTSAVAAALCAAADDGEIVMNDEASDRIAERMPPGLGPAEPVAAVLEGGATVDAIRLPAVGAPPDSAADGDRRPGPSRDNTMIREGELWSLAYGGRVVRLKDSKGLRDLARLLSSPGAEIAAVDLAAVATPVPAGRGARAAAELELAAEGDAGEVLDERARAEYRERLIDLETEVADAEASNDPERASRARQEREFIIDELGAAVGLMGKGRRALDPAERARKAVTWRLRDTIGRIAAADADLGRHLRHSIRTGAFCVYDPAVPTRWSTRS